MSEWLPTNTSRAKGVCVGLWEPLLDDHDIRTVAMAWRHILYVEFPLRVGRVHHRGVGTNAFAPDIVVIRRCQVSRREKEEHPAAKWGGRRGHHSWAPSWGFLKREIFFWALRISFGTTCKVGWPLLFEVIRKLWPSTWKTSSGKN